MALAKRSNDLARNSATSLKRLMPAMCITLFSDDAMDMLCLDDVGRITVPNHSCFDKIPNMSCSLDEHIIP